MVSVSASSVIGRARWSGCRGATLPGARVSTDLLGCPADPADQQPGRRGPPVRAVIGDGDLRTVHVDGVGPVCFAQSIQDAPQRSDPLGADGELDLRNHGGRASCPAK